MPPPDDSGAYARSTSFARVLADAIADITARGYESAEQIERWVNLLRTAAEWELGDEATIDRRMREAMGAIYTRLVDKGRVVQYVPEVSRYTLSMIRPQLRAELDRRILASADLIKLRRREAIEGTLARFRGWSTSIPPGGEGVIDKREVRESVGKSVAQLKFERRRVEIDQGHKLTANIANIVAVDNGAIAAEWHSHVHQAGYNARKEHAARDLKVYAIRDSWAHKAGLLNKGAGFTDEMTAPAQEVNCLPGGTWVPFADGVEVAYRRWYCGELAEVVTDSGKTLRATPNHPVLTPNGWVAIGSLKECDQVIELADHVVNAAKPNADHHHAIPSIAEIFGSLHDAGVIRGVRGAREQFHGDGAEGNVDIVYAARPLRFDGVTSPAQCGGKFRLALASVKGAFASALQFFAFGCTGAASSLMSGMGACSVLLRRLVLGNEFIGLLLATDSPASSNYAVGNGFAGHTERLCERQDAFAGFVAESKTLGIQEQARPLFEFGAEINFAGAVLAPQSGGQHTESGSDLVHRLPFTTKACHVIRVDRHQFAGHVYNLQTADGWYIADGIVTHNCRCYYKYVTSLRRLPDEMLTNKGREWLREAAAKRGAA